MSDVQRPMSGQRYLAAALHAYGVSHVFMVPSAFTAANAALDLLGVEVVMTHGEKAAAYMADAYARATKRPGVCFAQNIGASNLAAGLRDAYMANSPVIVLTGGTTEETSNRRVYQQIDDLGMFDSVTKLNIVVDSPHRLPELLRQAFRVATTGAPGPVHLRIPGATGESLNNPMPTGQTVWAEPRFISYPAFRPRPEADDIAATVRLLSASQRPVIVAGGGVRASGAEAELLELVEKLSIPVATSMNGKGAIDETHPLALGVVGSYSRDSANQAVAEADLVLFVGSGTGSQITDRWRLPAIGTTVIQIDINPEELGRHYPNAASVQGDAREVLRELIVAVSSHQATAWSGRAGQLVDEWRARVESDLGSTDQPIRPERICRAVQSAMPEDGILLSDTGHAGIWTASMIDLTPRQSFLRCAGSLGWALPAAIGAAAAAPDRTVIAFTGDGGFYYHLAELETAVRHKFRAKIVINNNQALSQNFRGFAKAFGEPIAPGGNRLWQFEKLDLAEVARSLGCMAIRVTDPDQLESAMQEAVAFDGPVVVDVIADPAVLAPPPHGGRDFYDMNPPKS